MRRFFVNANARNIAVIGVREHAEINAPIPANIYVLGTWPVINSIQFPEAKPMTLKDGGYVTNPFVEDIFDN